jgi:N-acetylneuraminic acid mutarotase
MVIRPLAWLITAVLFAASSLAAFAQTPNAVMNTRLFGYTLPRIPDPEGFAGAFAGVSGGALIVAGGANISGDKWAESLTKKWYDSIFVLEALDGKWKTGFKLPRPLGYGVCVTADDSVLCFGGSDAARHYAESFRLQWKQGKLRKMPFPALPHPCANACGALVGRTIYLAGGIETPTATAAMHTFWALDLDAPEPIWQELEPWPGPARMLSVAGAHDGSFYLFSGAALTADADGKPVREYLRDAYRFTPGQGWKRLADLPRATVAAPSPAPVVTATGAPALLVVSGDDGLNVNFQPMEKHPGFPRGSLLYDPAHDTWTTLAFPEISRATAPTVLWQKGIVIPNGEVRPRVRTPEVLGLQFP